MTAAVLSEVANIDVLSRELQQLSSVRASSTAVLGGSKVASVVPARRERKPLRWLLAVGDWW